MFVNPGKASLPLRTAHGRRSARQDERKRSVPYTTTNTINITNVWQYLDEGEPKMIPRPKLDRPVRSVMEERDRRQIPEGLSDADGPHKVKLSVPSGVYPDPDNGTHSLHTPRPLRRPRSPPLHRPRSPPPRPEPPGQIPPHPYPCTEHSMFPLVETIHGVCSIEDPRDVTVHLELDLYHDLEVELEAVCRFVRLGNFAEAERYLFANLEDQMRNPQVAIQYLHMLYEKGDFSTAFRYEIEIDSAPDELVNHWIILKECSNLRSRHIPDIAGTAEKDWRVDEQINDGLSADGDAATLFRKPNLEIDDTFTSTQLSTACLVMRLAAELGISEPLTPGSSNIGTASVTSHGDSRASHLSPLASLSLGQGRKVCLHDNDPERLSATSDTSITSIASSQFAWPMGIFYTLRLFGPDCSLQTRLCRQGRLWDFRDWLIESFNAPHEIGGWGEGEEVVAKRFMGVWDHWYLPTYDQSTYLALLDIYSAFILERWHKHRLHFLESEIVPQAQRLAIDIARHDPEGMRSRPYVSWILAKAVIHLVRHLGDEFAYLQLGRTKMVNPEFYVPIFAPRKRETQKMKIYPDPAIRKSLLTGLELCKQLQDHRSEALCRKLLVRVSPDPRKELDELAEFQLKMQGDKVGHVASCLSKYMLVTTRKSRDALCQELISLDRLIIENFSPSLSACSEMILRALTPLALMWTGRRNTLLPYIENIPKAIRLDVAPGLFGSSQDMSRSTSPVLGSEHASNNSHETSLDDISPASHTSTISIEAIGLGHSDPAGESSIPRNRQGEADFQPTVSPAGSPLPLARNEAGLREEDLITRVGQWRDSLLGFVWGNKTHDTTNTATAHTTAAIVGADPANPAATTITTTTSNTTEHGESVERPNINDREEYIAPNHRDAKGKTNKTSSCSRSPPGTNFSGKSYITEIKAMYTADMPWGAAEETQGIQPSGDNISITSVLSIDPPIAGGIADTSASSIKPEAMNSLEAKKTTVPAPNSTPSLPREKSHVRTSSK